MTAPSDFPIHTPDTDNPERRAILEKVKRRMGFVPNFIAKTSEAPQVAEAYLVMMELLAKSSLTGSERAVAWMAANIEHGCHYCMAAHTAIALGDKVPADVIEAARTGAPFADPRLNALRDFTLKVIRERGWVDGAGVDAFLEAGFTKQNVLEVVLVVSHKVLSNYANHMIDTPVDREFQQFAWTPAEAAE